MRPVYMPWPTRMDAPLEDVQMVAGITLPAWYCFPDCNRGLWRDCYGDRDKTTLFNMFLWLLMVADKASVTSYIEIVPERKLMESNTMIQVCYYRLHIPLTLPAMRAIILAMAMALADADENELNQTGARKKARSSSRNSPGGDMAETDVAASTIKIGAEQISNWPSFLRWHATATSRSIQRHREIVFDLPPSTVFDDGGLSGSGDDSPDTSTVTDWLDNLPCNHILSMLNLTGHFATGMERHRTRLHPDQLDMDAYFSGTQFQFPDVCNDNELCTHIESGAAWLEGNVNNLVHAPFAHAAATLTMHPGELYLKMTSMAAITGTTVPVEYQFKPLGELRALFLEQYGEGDVSNYSPITMLDPNEQHSMGEGESESENILAEMYPDQGRLTRSISTGYRQLRKALRNGDVTCDDVAEWTRETIERLNLLYSDAPKAGFVAAYARICREASGIKHRMHADGGDTVVRLTKTLLKKRFDKMDAGNSMYALQALLLRRSMHMTAAQAPPLQFIWVGTLTAIKGTINEPQPTIALMGPSDTGKSHLMEALQQMILSAAVVRRDTTSPLAMTCHSELGVQTTDELKTGVDTQDAHASTAWLTAWSTGLHVHERLRLGTRPGEETVNVVTKSDRRRFLVTATNHTPHANFLSRMFQYFMAGNQLEGDLSRQELSTLSNTSRPYLAAKNVFKYLWAEHEIFWRVHQHIRFYICTSWYSVWYSLANKVMGKKYSPSTRHVRSIKRFAYGYMLVRLIAQYLRTDKSESFMAYAMANAVVSLSDYMQCFTQQQKTADKQHEQDIVMRALLDNINIDEPPGGAFALESGGRDYYATSLSTVAEIASRTTGLTKATGVVKGIMSELEEGQSSDSGKTAMVIKMKAAGRNNRFAVHKSLVAIGRPRSVMTTAMRVILEFLKVDVIGKPCEGRSPKVWHVSYDETDIIFKRAVRLRLLNPDASEFESPVLDRANLSETDIMRGMLLLEAGGVLQFRDVHAPFPYVLSAEGALVSPNETQDSVLVGRAGPLDEMRMFGEVYISETPDDEITDEWIADRAAEISATTAPSQRLHKTRLRLPDAMKCNLEALRDAVDGVTQTKLGIPTVDNTVPDTSESALLRMWDAVAAISGEVAPGGVVYVGIPPTSSEPYETHTIREWHEPTISLLNPRRHTAAYADSATDTDLDEFLLPGGETHITFDAQAATMTEELCKRTAEINMASHGLLPDVSDELGEVLVD